MRYVDEIDVCLAYQVKLRGELNLPLDTLDMRFFGVSYVTKNDLVEALRDVTESAKTDFIHYFSTDWKPWQSGLQRLCGEKYEKAHHEFMTAIEGEFPARRKARLQKESLEGNNDADRIAGSLVLSKITLEIKDALTIKFLKTRGMEELLLPDKL